MKNLITILVLLSTLTTVGQSTRFGLVELNDKYEQEMQELNDDNSCAVRLIASHFGISYYDAYDKLKDNGRVHGEGTSITKIIKTFNRVQEDTFVNEFYDVSEKQGKKHGILLSNFLTNHAKENTSYILIHPGHITWIKVGEMGKKGLLNTLYGNSKDRAKRIIVFLEIKNR